MSRRTTRGIYGNQSRLLGTLAAAALVVMLAPACGDDDGTSPSENVASVTVTAGTSTLASLGATVQLQATALDANGDPVSGVTFTWTSNASGVASVDDNGLVTAVSNGSATITASVNGTSGSVAITVEQEAVEIAFAVPPTNNSVDEPFAQLEVEMRDANGNVTTNFEDAVTISIGTNPQGGSLSGQFTRDAVAGVASFPGLALDAAGAGYTLEATADGLSAESDPFNVTLPSVYVVNSGSNTVSVIATASNTVVATVTVGAIPRGMAISPDGLVAYVANAIDGTVSVIDTPTNTVSSTITVGAGPEGVAFTPDGEFAYVTNRNANSVSVIETSTNTVTATIADVGSDPTDVLVSPDGGTAYVALLGADSIVVISMASNMVTARVQIDNPTFKLGITPDGGSVYATGFGAGQVYVINTGANTFVATIPVGAQPAYVAFDPDGAVGYVTNSADNTISEIDPAANTVTETFAAGTTPAGVEFTPDGAAIYVANFGAGNVSVFDTSNNMSTSTVTVGANPLALRVMPAPVP